MESSPETKEPGPASRSRRLLLASSGLLVSTLFLPRFSTFQAILITPAIIALAVCFIAYLVISTLIRSDQHLPRPSARLRPLVFTTPSAWSAVLTRQSWEEEPSASRGPSLLLAAPVAVKSALDRLLELIQRHFILPWYARISPSPTFPNSSDTLIRHVLANLVNQGEHVDWSSLLVSRIVPIVKDHLQHYRAVEHLASSTSANSRTALPLPLPARSHPALSTQNHTTTSGTPPLVEAHLRAQTELILGPVLPDADRSEVVSLLVREILLGAVLLPVFDMLCDPDFWNRQIDDRGGKYLHEQRQVNRFLSALSTIPDPPSTTVTPVKPKTAYPPQASFISAESSTQQFDAFIRSISRLKTLGEARRFRADLERETRLAQASLREQEQMEVVGKDGERLLKRARKYVQRLDRASHQVDARIGVLSGLSANPEQIRSPQSALHIPSSLADISLQTVLLDPSSLAYWLEFMERRGRSKLVQFWLTVEGFKDPLESAEPSAPSFGAFDPIDTLSKTSSTILDDTSFLHEMYFVSGADMGVSARDASAIAEFVKNPPVPMTPQAVQTVKASIFFAQRAVYDRMEEADWGEFQRSELYRKAIQDLARHAPVDNFAFSPRSVTSPTIPSVPPIKPVRHVSSPLLERQKPKRVPTKIGPTLVNGSFTPSTVAAHAAISTTPPTFSRSLTQVRTISSIIPSDTRPSTPPSRPSHLDILFTGGANSPTATESDRRIFGNDDEADAEDDDDFVQVQRMEAIQAALSEIIASDDMVNSRVDHTFSTPESGAPSMSTSLVLTPPAKEERVHHKLASRSFEDLRSPPLPHSTTSAPQTRVPSQAMKKGDHALARRQSMSKLNSTADRDRLFDDAIDEGDIEDSNPAADPEFVQLAAPGNLHLAPEISRLESRVQELVKQENLLEGLIRRAELTGNEAELKLLQKSISTIRRELRGAVFQKAQYEQQEEENRLVPGRTVVAVPSAHVTADAAEGKQVARYAVRISQMGEDRSTVEGSWVVYRRYNQFFELDRAIKDWAAVSGDKELAREVRGLVELPGKKLGPSTSAGLMEARRQGLERYLKSLVSSSTLCDSDILRNFLSRSSPTYPSAALPGQIASVTSLAPHNIVRSLYKSVATTLDETPLGPSMLDMIHSTLNRQFSDVAGGLGEVVELGGELFGYGSSFIPPLLRQGVGGLAASPEIGGTGSKPANGGNEAESGNTVFTAPICDLFIEMFDLDESNWLRRQAIVVILQQFLGSTIERKVRDTLRSITEAEALKKLLDTFSDTLFPDGERRPPSDERTDAEKLATRQRASKKLAMLIPDIAANMIGRSNARRAARRVFGVLQDKRLNQHLVLKMMDEVVGAVFPKPKGKAKG